MWIYLLLLVSSFAVTTAENRENCNDAITICDDLVDSNSLSDLENFKNKFLKVNGAYDASSFKSFSMIPTCLKEDNSTVIVEQFRSCLVKFRFSLYNHSLEFRAFLEFSDLSEEVVKPLSKSTKSIISYLKDPSTLLLLTDPTEVILNIIDQSKSSIKDFQIATKLAASSFDEIQTFLRRCFYFSHMIYYLNEGIMIESNSKKDDVVLKKMEDFEFKLENLLQKANEEYHNYWPTTFNEDNDFLVTNVVIPVINEHRNSNEQDLAEFILSKLKSKYEREFIVAVVPKEDSISVNLTGTNCKAISYLDKSVFIILASMDYKNHFEEYKRFTVLYMHSVNNMKYVASKSGHTILERHTTLTKKQNMKVSGSVPDIVVQSTEDVDDMQIQALMVL